MTGIALGPMVNLPPPPQAPGAVPAPVPAAEGASFEDMLADLAGQPAAVDGQPVMPVRPLPVQAGETEPPAQPAPYPGSAEPPAEIAQPEPAAARQPKPAEVAPPSSLPQSPPSPAAAPESGAEPVSEAPPTPAPVERAPKAAVTNPEPAPPSAQNQAPAPAQAQAQAPPQTQTQTQTQAQAQAQAQVEVQAQAQSQDHVPAPDSVTTPPPKAGVAPPPPAAPPKAIAPTRSFVGEADGPLFIVEPTECTTGPVQSDRQAAPQSSEGFLAARQPEPRDGEPAPRSLAEIFNEHGFFGRALRMGLHVPAVRADVAAPASLPPLADPVATAPFDADAAVPAPKVSGVAAPSQAGDPPPKPLAMAPGAVARPAVTAPVLAGIVQVGRAFIAAMRAGAAMPGGRFVAQARPLPAAGPRAAANEAKDSQPAERRTAVRPSPRQPRDGELAARLSLQVAQLEATLVARLDRLSREDRIKLREEAARLLAAYGLAPGEIRINGAVETGRSS